jgi:hypothetical protein
VHILDYIEDLPNDPQSELMKYLHHFLSSYPELNVKVMFSTPFYTRNKWMIYLNKLKDRSIEVCFVQAIRFKEHRELLDFKKRKQVGGIAYFTVEDINEEVLDLLIAEAINTDDRLRSPAKKNNNKPVSRK